MGRGDSKAIWEYLRRFCKNKEKFLMIPGNKICNGALIRVKLDSYS